MEDVNKAMETLKGLVGMENVKAQFEQYLTTMQTCRQRGEHFRPHMAFMGNPGTGKTTVASLFSKILYEYGLLSKAQLVVVTPADLIGEYVGQSGPKARKQFERAHGGILFIDEAYQLCSKDQVRARGQYEKEVITELLTFMENDRDAIVILAGYPDVMNEFLSCSNPGLRPRISLVLNFEDFTNDELTEIFRRKLAEKDYTICEDALAQAKAYFASLNRSMYFGNARESERLLDIVKANQTRRLALMTNPSGKDFFTIFHEDIPLENEE